jgi:hypothetical protein
VHAATNADHLCVVVLAGQCGGLDAPPQRAPYAWHLVGGDLLTITRTAEHDAEAARVGDGALRGGDELSARSIPANEWYGMLDAPKKHSYVIENSGHATAFEGFEEFTRIMNEVVLPETYPGRAP